MCAVDLGATKTCAVGHFCLKRSKRSTKHTLCGSFVSNMCAVDLRESITRAFKKMRRISFFIVSMPKICALGLYESKTCSSDFYMSIVDARKISLILKWEKLISMSLIHAQ